jgi:hypothetical protein
LKRTYYERIRAELEALEQKIRGHGTTPGRLRERAALRLKFAEAAAAVAAGNIVTSDRSEASTSLRYARSSARPAARAPSVDGRHRNELATSLRVRSRRGLAHYCRHCGAPLKDGIQQGRRRYCDDACKMRGFRRRRQGLPESIREHQGSSLESWHARGDE